MRQIFHRILGMKLFFYLALSTGMIFGQGVQDAGTYHNNSSQQWNLVENWIESISWEGNERVLDVGCGDGKITALIASKVPSGQVVGLDVSPSMVQFAASQFQSPVLSFAVGDAAHLSFEQNFDVVVSFSTLHWVLDQESALKGIARALAPGGKAYIKTYGKAPMNFVAVCEKLMHSDEWRGLFPEYRPQRVYFTPEEYQALLNGAGFDRVELTSYWYEYPLPDREAAFRYAKPLINFIGHLSGDLQEKFVNEFIDEILKLAQPAADGSIVFRFLILQVIAS